MRDRRYLVGIAIIAIVILFNLPLAASSRLRSALREILAPFQNMVAGVIYRCDSAVSALVQRGEPTTEKERLFLEIAQLREAARGYAGLEQENAELREKLEFAARSRVAMTICEVIGRGEASGWWETVRLNKGRNHGIKPRMAVIAREGLVGEVMSVSARTCDVLLITDPNCRVSARFARTGAFGVVRGVGAAVTGDPALDMCFPIPDIQAEFVTKHMRLRKGDAVLTSGLGGVYPAGLLIGYVGSIAMDQSGLYQCASLAPAADIGNLRYLFVLGSTESAKGGPR